MAALVTLAVAKSNMKITGTVEDSDIARKIEEASDSIVQIVTHEDKATWTDADVPSPVRAAVLLVLTHFHDHIGENMATDADLWNAVEGLLTRTGYRDPALA